MLVWGAGMLVGSAMVDTRPECCADYLAVSSERDSLQAELAWIAVQDSVLAAKMRKRLTQMWTWEYTDVDSTTIKTRIVN